MSVVLKESLNVKALMHIFEIFSVPKPQQQTKFRRTPLGVRAYDPSKMTKQQIQWQINPNAPEELLRGAVWMELTFFMPIPVSTTRTVRAQMINGTVRPIVRPDFDNLAYIITNALKGLVYRDDSQVVDCRIQKYYAEIPRTVIKVKEL